MPRVSYSQEQREKIRSALVSTGLALMSQNGIQHTTVRQVYEAVGISRTFFYSFFPTKEDLIVEILYLQQPKIVAYAQSLMQDPALSWHDAVRRFLLSCCYGEKHGIAVLSIEEQQALFRRLSKQSRILFREKQRILFGKILEAFQIPADKRNIDLFINLSLSVMVVCRAIPQSLPLFVPEAAEQTVAVQIELLTNWLETLRPGAAPQPH